MNIDRAETLRYLGFRGQELSPSDLDRLDRAAELTLAAADVRTAKARFGLEPDGVTLQGTGVTFCGSAIGRHLAGCVAVYVVACTLGLGVDRLIARLMREDPALGVMADASAVSLIESVADDLSDEISDAEGGRTTRRFSCGYADFPLEQQTDFMRLLDMGRRLGVFIGADYLMTPQKTVTAVIGVRGEREEQ